MESNDELIKYKEQLKVLKNVIKPNESNKVNIDLGRIEQIINFTLPESLEKNAPPNFPELYFDFKYEYDKFREFILYEHLIGKRIITLGGGFSSGKSSFLNSLIGKKILPQDIDPSTSVPAYIVGEQDTFVYGVNAFNAKIQMEIKDVKMISHGFGETLDENDEIISDEITLGHILKSIFISTPLQTYKNIAFLDTPGYSKADTESYSAKTDEKIARAQLNSSDYILWFIQADAGTITEEDIRFINTLKKEIPKLIIVNKADKRTNSDIKDIVSKIKNVLDIKGIKYVDVLSYSSKKSKDFDGDKLKKYIEYLDERINESNFAYNFKVLFSKCKDFYDESIDVENKKLNRLNTALTLCDNDKVTECITSLLKESKRNLNGLKDMKSILKDIQNEFFSEIKKISDLAGIEMPEPSEIDLIKNKIVDPLKVVQKFRVSNGINSNSSLRIIIEDILGDVNPVINEAQGGFEYNRTIEKIINENLQIDKNKIKFNDLYENSKRISDIISKQL